MNKKEASIVLDNELYELNSILEKAKAIGEVSKDYFFYEAQNNATQEKLNNASYLNDIILECLCKACELMDCIGN